MKNESFHAQSESGITKAVTLSIICLIFLVAGLLFSRDENFLLWLLPVGLMLVILLFSSIDIFLLAIVFLTPLSVQLRFIMDDPPADLFLPTEIMLVGAFLIVAFKLIISKEFGRDILTHPVTVIIYFLIGWALITSLTSVNPVVSIKNVLSKLWFISGFYLLALGLFQKRERLRSYLLAYISGMIPVIIYFLIMMVKSGLFNQQMSHSVIRPFFNDHTSFGASLAFCIPVIVYFIFSKNKGTFYKIIFSLIFFLFSAAFIFSYSRAAWLSLIIASLFVLIILLRIPWSVIIASAVIGIVVVISSWTNIMMKLSENKQVSTSNIALHLQSVANITSDVSNAERINRWNSAIRMFEEKPFLGWGPGTYQFEYASFQMAADKTEISTNFGDGGNAHSEYLGTLVDSGVPGLFIYLALVIFPLARGIWLLKRTGSKEDKFLLIVLMTGLVTYVIHGLLNNFLDTDKISALFWGYTAGITAFDIKWKNGAALSGKVSSND